jgi:hypothetical protein
LSGAIWVAKICKAPSLLDPATPFIHATRENAPWDKPRLLNIIAQRDAVSGSDGKPVDVSSNAFEPTPECHAHVQRLIAIIDERDAMKKRIWAAHDRLERKWERSAKDHWRLFRRVMRTKAATLQGIAAQVEIADLDGAIGGYYALEIDQSLLRVLRNLRSLVAPRQA